MRRLDIVSGATLTLLGLITIFVIVPNQISGSSEYGIAPDVFPLTLLWTTTFFAALLCVSRLLKKDTQEERTPLPFREIKFVAVIAVFLAAIVTIIAYVGFIVGGIIAIAVLMFAMGEYRHWVRLTLVSVLTPAILYLVFWKLFHVPLP